MVLEVDRPRHRAPHHQQHQQRHLPGADIFRVTQIFLGCLLLQKYFYRHNELRARSDWRGERRGGRILGRAATFTLQHFSIGVKPQQTAFKRPNKNSLDIIFLQSAYPAPDLRSGRDEGYPGYPGVACVIIVVVVVVIAVGVGVRIPVLLCRCCTHLFMVLSLSILYSNAANCAMDQVMK